jgi:hypothetical protein
VNTDALVPMRERIGRYYSSKVREHGPTPAGADWTCAPTQELRFVQLLRLCDFEQPFSLDDLGCGWGALRGFVARRYRAARIDYLGIDVSPAMIEQAQVSCSKHPRTAFLVGDRSPRVADYAVASGIFNVRIDEPLDLWESGIEQTLRQLAAGTSRGFAVNFLATLPPGMESKPQLYRCTPDRWAGLCSRLGCGVTVLDRYGMREFTLLARH